MALPNVLELQPQDRDPLLLLPKAEAMSDGEIKMDGRQVDLSCDGCGRNELRPRKYDVATRKWLCTTCRQSDGSGSIASGQRKDNTPEPITP